MKPEQTSQSPAEPAGACASWAATAATWWTAVLSSAVLTLAGCANPAGIAPHAVVVDASRLGLSDAPPAAVDPAWWLGIGDPVLTGLIDRALADNPNLRLAQTRIERAQAAVAGAQADSGPQVSASADTTRQRFSSTSIYPPPLGGSIRTLANAQLAGSWEFDFFGRHAAALSAALGSTRAAQAEAQAARHLLASSVARTYVQLGRLQEQRTVALSALKQREQLLALVQQRVQAGLDTNVELRQSEGALPDARLQTEQIDEQLALARNALAALTAQAPAALDGLVVSLDRLNIAGLPASIPADLLGRRADIQAARLRIEAAGSDMQAARAAFYPNINLTAFVGLSSIGLDRLVNAASEQYGAGPALRLPIFDSGRLRARLQGKATEVDAAVESYNAAVIEAVHEVADPLASLRGIARQQQEQQQAQQAAEAAFDLAGQRFKAGLSNYLTVLNAENAVLAQRRHAVDLKARTLDARLQLIRALGGGYVESSPSAAAAAATTAATTSAQTSSIPGARS